MTAQMPDFYKYNGKEYSLVAISEALNFKPQDYGFEPRPISTDCWRGYWCDYNMSDDELMLQNLYICLEGDEYPDFNGIPVEPIEYVDRVQLQFREDGGYEEKLVKSEKYYGYRVYKNINLPIKYTGKILLGDGFIDKYYIHMGFQRAYAYERLMEFIFEEGILIEKVDQSVKALEMRKQMDEECDDLAHPDGGNILKFVEDSFSTAYKVKAWWM